MPSNCHRSHRLRLARAVAAVLSLTSAALAAGPNPITVGHARFTVVTPNLIRMEYAPAGRFVDAPSWLAADRSARFDDATVSQDGRTLTIDTGPVRLHYVDDGKPFSAINLSAEARRGEASVAWRFGDTNRGNLGGTLRTLDRIRGAVPLGEGVVSRDGWAVIDDSHNGLFSGDWVRARPDPDNADLYLFGYGLDYRAALKSLTAIGGPVPMPRKYMLGLWYSRYWPFTADAFKRIVDEYDTHGFPLDTLVMDMGWHLNAVPPGIKTRIDTWTGFTWDPSLIPDPVGLLKWMHDRGLHVTLNDHPAAGVQPHEAAYPAFMRALDQDPASCRTVPFDAGSKSYLDAFWRHTHKPLEDQGVDFWWLDWQQSPKTRSIPELDNLQVLNWYYFNQSKSGGRRGASFSRWAGWGDHRDPIHFSGDADTGWPMLAFEVPFTSTAGNVGCFFWSHDIGGHMGGRNEESYARWCQFGALSAALRSHSTMDPTTDRRPWNYPAWAEASMKVSFRLRATLLPYLYTAMHAATADSVPFLRPVYFDHPTVEAAYHNAQEYLFGDDLLVAPIARPGTGPGRVAAQAVWFPPGEHDWFDFFTGERFAPGESAVATAPIDQFPLYVRGGVPLPMQPYDHRPATVTPATLVLRCYPGRDGSTSKATVYEDDGVTDGYAKGQAAATSLSYARHGDTAIITVGAAVGTYPGRPDERAVVIELPNTEPGATADAGRCTYDASTDTTRVDLPAAPVNSARVVTVRMRITSPDKVAAAATESKLQKLLGQSLTDWQASHPVPPADLARLIAAVQGVAVLDVNPHPYGLGDNADAIYFHNHHAAAEMLTLDGESRSVMPGTVIAAGTTPPGAFRYARDAVVGLPGGREISVELPQFIVGKEDIARSAVATASTGRPEPAIDGSTDGYPADQRREWVTTHEKAGAWIKLTWPAPVKIGRILLYDRPNAADQVLAGTLEFGDGTALPVDALPNDGRLPAVITFPAKTCTSVRFTITRTGPRTENAGLSEIVVTP